MRKSFEVGLLDLGILGEEAAFQEILMTATPFSD